MQDVAAEESVSAMPTFKIYKHGGCVDTVTGARQMSLQSMVIKHIHS